MRGGLKVSEDKPLLLSPLQSLWFRLPIPQGRGARMRSLASVWALPPGTGPQAGRFDGPRLRSLARGDDGKARTTVETSE